MNAHLDIKYDYKPFKYLSVNISCLQKDKVKTLKSFNTGNFPSDYLNAVIWTFHQEKFERLMFSSSLDNFIMDDERDTYVSLHNQIIGEFFCRKSQYKKLCKIGWMHFHTYAHRDIWIQFNPDPDPDQKWAVKEPTNCSSSKVLSKDKGNNFNYTLVTPDGEFPITALPFTQALETATNMQRKVVYT